MTTRHACSAIPAAARRGHREDRGCASTTDTSIEYAGEFRYLCEMHLNVWGRAESDEQRADLAKKWGWT